MSSQRNPPNESKPTSFRLLHINIHGLTMKDSLYRIKLANLLSTKPDIVSLNEINLNINKEDIHRKIYQASRIKTLPVSLSLNHNHDPSEEDIKYGGVAMAASGRTVSRIVDKDKDHFGRWVRYSIVGKGHRKISFISAYQCCQGNINQDVSRNTVYAQEYRSAISRSSPISL
jgi:hypothetical protein